MAWTSSGSRRSDIAREARYVREHHGGALSFTLESALGGEDLLGEVLRRVGLRRGVARRRRLRDWRGRAAATGGGA